MVDTVYFESAIKNHPHCQAILKRMPRQNFKIIHDLYPEEKILNQEFELTNGMLSYPQQKEQEMMAFCESALLKYIPQSAYFPCRW